MACEICNRSSCTRSFHLLESQEDFDRQRALSKSVKEFRDMPEEQHDDYTIHVTTE